MSRLDAEMTVLAIFNDDQYVIRAKRSDFGVIAEQGHQTLRVHETDTCATVGRFWCGSVY